MRYSLSRYFIAGDPADAVVASWSSKRNDAIEQALADWIGKGWHGDAYVLDETAFPKSVGNSMEMRVTVYPCRPVPDNVPLRTNGTWSIIQVSKDGARQFAELTATEVER